jgi:undecaprenyl-diphosphatase
LYYNESMATNEKVNPSTGSGQGPSAALRAKLLSLAMVFGAITALVANGSATGADMALLNFVYSIRSAPLNGVMFSATFLGSTPFIAMAAIIIVVILRLKKSGRFSNLFWITLTASAAIDNLLKYLIRRDRPNVSPLDSGTTYSFPSGHAMNSLVFYGLIAYFIHQRIKNKNVLAVTDVAGVVLVLSIGFSRVYLGAHYPTDVLAGFAGGALVLIIAISNFRKV